jgi:hypothetical protein
MDKLYMAFAIQKLRPGVGFAMDGTDYTTIVWNAENVEPLDEAELLATIEIVKVEEEAKKQVAKDVKASALAKLAALGLTQDEVKALVG